MSQSAIVRAARSFVSRHFQKLPHYDLSLFSSAPLERLSATAMTAERPDGGWRGYAAIPTERRWSDIFTIDVFLTNERPQFVVEFGTGTGAFSCYLATYAALNGASFRTFDTHGKGAATKRINHQAQDVIRRLGGVTHHRDVFDASTIELVANLVGKHGKTLIYCDNGNKVRELEQYVPTLKTGDFIGVHDFGSEICHHHLLPFTRGGRCELWNPGLFESLDSSNRLLKRMPNR